ncbi:hypothetical protein ACFWUQ_24855 [Streptomyces sp. NPDC058662]|uniref:hypothetical protein n=1 Tax=Streptomyces sp. NPDC058662 TaxID=3346583 RepID=UPI00365294D0
MNGATFVPRWAVHGLLVLLEHLTLRASQRAEYLADASAARTGSTEAAIALMDRLLIAHAVEMTLRRESAAANLRGGPAGRAAVAQAEAELWERLAAHTASIPEHEYERLRRLAALRGHSVDSTHPPTHLRRRIAASAGPRAARVVLGEVRAAAVAAELRTARAVVGRRIIRDQSLGHVPRRPAAAHQSTNRPVPPGGWEAGRGRVGGTPGGRAAASPRGRAGRCVPAGTGLRASTVLVGSRVAGRGGRLSRGR